MVGGSLVLLIVILSIFRVDASLICLFFVILSIFRVDASLVCLFFFVIVFFFFIVVGLSFFVHSLVFVKSRTVFVRWKTVFGGRLSRFRDSKKLLSYEARFFRHDFLQTFFLRHIVIALCCLFVGVFSSIVFLADKAGESLLPIGLEAFLNYNPIRATTDPTQPLDFYRSVRWADRQFRFLFTFVLFNPFRTAIPFWGQTA